MSFIVDMSKDRLYGLKGPIWTIDSAITIEFIKKYWRLAKTYLIFSERKAFLVWDNTSIHKSAKVKEFIRGTEIKKYLQFALIVPVEKLILFIKSKIRQNKMEEGMIKWQFNIYDSSYLL